MWFAVDEKEQLGVGQTEVDGQGPGGAQVVDRIVGRLQRALGVGEAGVPVLGDG
jgi:hypothetical protein